MPPKKKKRVVNPDSEAGTAISHIIQNFSSFPSINDVKNGHVLHVYVTVGENRSRAKTERQLKSHYSSVQIQRSLDASIKKLVSQTLQKFHKLTNPTEFERFAAICDEHFTLFDSNTVDPTAVQSKSNDNVDPDPVPSTSDDSIQETTVQSPTHQEEHVVPCKSDLLTSPLPTSSSLLTPPLPTSSTRSTRSQTQSLTPRKASMKRRLDFLSASSVKLKKQHKESVSYLKEKLKTPKRVINQAIQRKLNIIKKKDQKIHDLNLKLAGCKLSNELGRVKVKLNQLENAHQKLLQKKKKKRLQHSVKTVSVSKYRQVQQKVKEKDAVITDLQHQHLLFQEDVEDKTCGLRSKVDGKTYSSSIDKIKSI
ncbi:hypothetical protein SNE40_022066 [Patella caerulea]|uniref:Uncharacterized protein n=1 Tax=Patella caerulea TaxID=87958 RepID=A0AAN8GH26_PATCE